MKAHVYVTLKRGVLDAQGQAVHKALAQLGFDGVTGVRVGKFIEVELDTDDTADEARARVEDMCRKLISNPVIEEFRVEIAGRTGE